MTKIEALKKTVYNLENNVYKYSWKDGDNCNCGVLARTITGKVPTKIGHQGGHWGRAAICLTTNEPLSKVFQALKDSGFTKEDIVNLEYYGDKRIAAKLGYTQEFKEDGRPFGYSHCSFDSKKTLIEYLKAWVEILEEQEQPITVEPEIKTIIKYVAVDAPIREVAMELAVETSN